MLHRTSHGHRPLLDVVHTPKYLVVKLSLDDGQSHRCSVLVLYRNARTFFGHVLLRLFFLLQQQGLVFREVYAIPPLLLVVRLWHLVAPANHGRLFRHKQFRGNIAYYSSLYVNLFRDMCNRIVPNDSSTRTHVPPRV